VWHDFVEDMANSKVGNRLEAIQQTVGDDIGIEVRVEIPDLIEAGDERGKRSIGFRRGQWSDELRLEDSPRLGYINRRYWLVLGRYIRDIYLGEA